MPRPVLVCSLLAALLCQAAFGSPIEGVNSQELQDILTFINNLQQRSRLEGGSGRLEELASMMKAAGSRGDNQESELQLPPLQARLLTFMQNEEFNKDKRASYMSLCHFKICNMGRKRNPYWNTWSRA